MTQSKSTNIIILGIIALLSVSFAQASWTGQTAQPTGNNTPPPILTNASSQEKIGDFTILENFEVRNASTFLGRVGAGTATPSNALEVAGKIEADQYCDRTGTNCLTAQQVRDYLDTCSCAVVVPPPYTAAPVHRSGTDTYFRYYKK